MARQPTDQYMPMFIVAAVRCRPGEYLFSSKDSQNAFCPTVCTNQPTKLLHIQRRHQQELFHQNWKIGRCNQQEKAVFWSLSLLINSHRKYAVIAKQRHHRTKRCLWLLIFKFIPAGDLASYLLNASESREQKMSECTETARLHFSMHGLTSLNITPPQLPHSTEHIVLCNTVNALLLQVDRSSNPKCGSEFELFVSRKNIKERN
ncbi:hypothetical protein T05_4687 [Trichinella murrelli]|uniref:Uncharacterized protein n=1 Tax=Trichinella murrelli TaxID=144512 RepID=A0A0V0U5H6_9BILA|nr:hypothetical protein T05_4687 [Trichinella murrelli]